MEAHVSVLFGSCFMLKASPVSLEKNSYYDTRKVLPMCLHGPSHLLVSPFPRRVYPGQQELNLLLNGFKIQETGDVIGEKITQNHHLENSFLEAKYPL